MAYAYRAAKRRTVPKGKGGPEATVRDKGKGELRIQGLPKGETKNRNTSKG